MTTCEQELCRHWTGEGCACAVFGLPTSLVACQPDEHEPTPSERLLLGIFGNDTCQPAELAAVAERHPAIVQDELEIDDERDEA